MLQLAEAFQDACGKRLRVDVVARREGDVDTLIADPRRVAEAWGWRTTRDLGQMCADAWRFQRNNPAGYPERDYVIDVQARHAVVGLPGAVR